MLSQLEIIRLAITKVLQIEIVNNSYIYLSLWSIVHLFSGMLVMGYLVSIKVKNPLFWLFVALLSYEIIEWWAIYQFPYFFLPESFLDAVWDIIIGMIGGIVILKIKKP